MTALEYFNGDSLAADAWASKYKAEGEVNPDDTHRRLAKEFARIEAKYPYGPEDNVKWNNLSYYGRHRDQLDEDSIYNLFKDFKYIIPGGSPTQVVGTNKISSTSNCFFNGVTKDNIEDIFNKAKSMAQIGKMRGGTSTDLSELRPRGAKVNNSSNESSGPIPFLELFDTTGKLIGQNGRKMAMMITMDINHPDIAEFATIKNDLSKITNANLSIKLNNEFIKAVKEDTDYILRWPCDSNIDLKKIDDLFKGEFAKNGLSNSNLGYNELYSFSQAKSTTDNKTIYIKRIKAKELWNTIINSAWRYAEPKQKIWVL